MISSNNSRRLVELALAYVSAESEQQATQNQDEAATLVTQTTTLNTWFELIDYIKAWNDSHEPKNQIGRAKALQFFLTRQAELETSPTSTP